MTLQRITATITSVAERAERAVQSYREPRSIPSSEATLAGLALAPRTVLALSSDEFDNLESIVSDRQSATTR
jgi:hypothetical protein